jgi:pimeloyl-ACP methyl ester carboxylesterase
MSADVVTLAHEEEGRGQPLILLHAFPLHRGMWAPQREALAGVGRLVLPDLRGFGASPEGTGPALMESMADDVLALADRLGIARFVLGGLSMGGYVSLALLRRAPERVSGLFLADTRCVADTDEARASRRASRERLLAEGTAVLEETMIGPLFSERTPRESPELVETVRGWIRSVSPTGAAAALEGMARRSDTRAVLENYEGPVLVLVGEEDTLTPPPESEAMAAAAPHSRLVRIPGAGHLANLEADRAFSAALAEHWKACADREPS